MKKKYKILLIIIAVLVVLLLGISGYFLFIHKTPEEPPLNEVKITNTIDEYGYLLEERDTELFKEKFESLKTLLNAEEFDKQQYIQLVSELFIIDLYTIDNKISRYDVGGLEYVYAPAVESLKSVAINSIYKTVENNVDFSRTQELPVVTSITVGEITNYEYQMPDESTVSGYRVPVEWTYEKELGYDKSGVLILIPEDKKISIVFFKPKS